MNDVHIFQIACKVKCSHSSYNSVKNSWTEWENVVSFRRTSPWQEFVTMFQLWLYIVPYLQIMLVLSALLTCNAVKFPHSSDNFVEKLKYEIRKSRWLRGDFPHLLTRDYNPSPQWGALPPHPRYRLAQPRSPCAPPNELLYPPLLTCDLHGRLDSLPCRSHYLCAVRP